MPEIEAAYKSLVEQYESRSHTSTSCADVLKVMAERPEKIWWWSWELCGGKLSHRGAARASDLANFHPYLVEDRKIGRFSVYRLRTENMEAVGKFIQCNK